MKRSLIALLAALMPAAALAQSGPPPGGPGPGGPPPGGPPGGGFPGNFIPNGAYTAPPGAGSRADPARLPNFAGVWMRAEGLTHPDQTKILPFMTPAAAADWRPRIAAHDFRVPWSFCEPPAFPAMISEIGLPFELLQTPGRLTEIIPDGEIRTIWTDGSRPFAAPPGGTYYGNAVGAWHNGTLTVTTTDMRADNDVVMGLQAGTDAMTVTEHLRLVSPDKLQDDFTVTGPAFLATPYHYVQYYTRYKKLRLGEFVCIAAKNRDNGTSVDLTPPP